MAFIDGRVVCLRFTPPQQEQELRFQPRVPDGNQRGVVIKRLLALVLAFASMISAADAHHKPGHNPPGHMKHGKKVVIHRSVVPEREISRWAWADEIVIGVADDSADSEDDALIVSELVDMDWRIYRDTVFDFGIELPFAVFEPGLEVGRGLRLDQVDGGQAHLDVYGDENAQGLSP